VPAPNYKEYSDEKLMVLLREGDIEAYGELYFRFFPRALRWYLQALGQRFQQDAEDLAQAVMLKVWRKHHTYVQIGDRRVLPWFYSIVLTTRVSFFRKPETRIRQVTEIFKEELPAPLSELFALGYYLRRLPLIERQVIELTIEGLTLDEVAEVLSLSRTTVFRRKIEAHKKLEKLLGAPTLSVCEEGKVPES
jgi:RNA polymerase sigma-70 factor, ECF subfamily